MSITQSDIYAAKLELAKRGQIGSVVTMPPKMAELFEGKARYRVSRGGRGSGKSRSKAKAAAVKGCVFAALGRSGVILCGREFQASLRDSSFAEVREAIKSDPWLMSQYDIGREYIRHISGLVEFVFIGLRHNVESIKGIARILLAWIDEAEQVSEMSWKVFIPTVREPDSEIWLSYNPAKEDSATNRRFYLEKTDNMKVVSIQWFDNPWFPAELDQERLNDLAMRPLDYEHIWEGAYSKRQDSLVFTNWRVEEFTAPSDAVLRFGADWGFAIDPTVLVRGYIDGRKLYIDYEAYQIGCEIDNTPVLFDGVPRSREFRITADSSRPELVSYMRRNGFPKIVPAIKGKGSIEDGIGFLQSFEIIVHPRCLNVIKELAGYSYKVDRHTDEVLPYLEDKDNHTIDALRYALEGLRRAGTTAKPVIRDTTTPKDRYVQSRSYEDDGGYYG